MVGMPPSTLLGRWPSVSAATSPCRCGLLQPPSDAPLTARNSRSTGLPKLSSLPSTSLSKAGANVVASMAAAVLVLASIVRYQTGRPKLNPFTRFKGNGPLHRIDRDHLIVHFRIVNSTVREADLRGVHVKRHDGGVVDDSTGVNDANQRTIICITHGTRRRCLRRKTARAGHHHTLR